MKMEQMYHLIKAVADVTGVYEIIVIGSQSILGSFPNAHPKLVSSKEGDFIPILSPEQLLQYDNQHYLDLIEGSLGEFTPFQKKYDVFADGCEFNTATLPIGWKDRLIEVQDKGTDLRIAKFLDPHDLAVSKLVAHREKDTDFLKVMYEENMLHTRTLKDRLDAVPSLDIKKKEYLHAWIDNQQKLRLQRLMEKPSLDTIGDAYTQDPKNIYASHGNNIAKEISQSGLDEKSKTTRIKP